MRQQLEDVQSGGERGLLLPLRNCRPSNRWQLHPLSIF